MATELCNHNTASSDHHHVEDTIADGEGALGRKSLQLIAELGWRRECTAAVMSKGTPVASVANIGQGTVAKQMNEAVTSVAQMRSQHNFKLKYFILEVNFKKL